MTEDEEFDAISDLIDQHPIGRPMSRTGGEPPHKWSWCGLCTVWTLLCGRCGNNVCGAGIGEEMGPEPGTTIPCRRCEDAYQQWKAYDGPIDDSSVCPDPNNCDPSQSVDMDARETAQKTPT